MHHGDFLPSLGHELQELVPGKSRDTHNGGRFGPNGPKHQTRIGPSMPPLHELRHRQVKGVMHRHQERPAVPQWNIVVRRPIERGIAGNPQRELNLLA